MVFFVLFISHGIKAQAPVGIAKITPTITNVIDPCSCTDPLNRTVGGVFLFHDLLTVTGTASQTLRIHSSNNTEILDVNGNPITFPAMLTETPLGSGTYQLTYYKRSNASSDIVFRFNNDTFSDSNFTTSTCNAVDCNPIPTMSQWGLLTFGLLILNIGVFLVGRQEMV